MILFYVDTNHNGCENINKILLPPVVLLITIIFMGSGCIQQNINPQNTIYVGGTLAEYITIQAAINAAENGTTIIIAKGSYNELLHLNKTVTLRGEDKNTTIIDFNPSYHISQIPIIKIAADHCVIENLQITLSNTSMIARGISISSKNNTIKNTIITNVADGLELSSASAFNTITYNEIKNNLIGITTTNSNNNTITHNIISNNTQYNIYLSVESNQNKVSFNIMDTSAYGIRIKGSTDNRVYKNCFRNNGIGIYCCCGARVNHFYNNTLLNSSVDNAQQNTGLVNDWWDFPNGRGNYWDDYEYFGVDENNDGFGDTPYEVVEGGKDMYPLLAPPVDVPCGILNDF